MLWKDSLNNVVNSMECKITNQHRLDSSSIETFHTRYSHQVDVREVVQLEDLHD